MKAYKISAESHDENHTIVIAIALSMEQAEKYVTDFKQAMTDVRAMFDNVSEELADWSVKHHPPKLIFDEAKPVGPQYMEHKDLHPEFVKTWKEWNERNSHIMVEYNKRWDEHNKARNEFYWERVNTKTVNFTEMQKKAQSIGYYDNVSIKEVDLAD